MRLFFRLFLWMSITVLSLQGGAAMAVGQLEQPAHATMAMAGPHCHEAAHAAHAKCASCAACCVGAPALPALPPGFHAPTLSASLHAPAEAAMSSVVPATLERPPRHCFV